MNSRRSFIKTTTVGLAGLSITSTTLSSSLYSEDEKRPVHIFTKCLQFLDYEDMVEVVAENGFSGADLTVRPGGQVAPENVKTDLLRVVNADIIF